MPYSTMIGTCEAATARTTRSSLKAKGPQWNLRLELAIYIGMRVKIIERIDRFTIYQVLLP